jgi:glycosyltransferase involved in cell wall biosynthesis
LIKYSIIIPTYNRANLLDRCLNSLTKQNYINYEVLVCDDGSIDNTEEVVTNYQNLLNIKYFKIDNWGGPARPRNIGIKNAQGEWLCFLDSDDFWSENKLELIDLIINDNIDLVYHTLGLFYNNFYSASKKTLFSRALRGNYFKDLLLNGNVINNSSIVVRKEIINKVGGVSEEKSMIGCEDYNTLLKVALLTSKIVYIPKVLGYYDMHLEGISRKDMSDAHATAVKEFLPLCTKDEKAKIDAHIKYMKCSYLVNSISNSKINNDILFCLKNGKFNIKLKSLLLFLKNLIKHVS